MCRSGGRYSCRRREASTSWYRTQRTHRRRSGSTHARRTNLVPNGRLRPNLLGASDGIRVNNKRPAFGSRVFVRWARLWLKVQRVRVEYRRLLQFDVRPSSIIRVRFRKNPVRFASYGLPGENKQRMTLASGVMISYPNLLSEKQAAKRLGVARITLLRAREAGRIRFFRIGTPVLYCEKQLTEFLASCEGNSREEQDEERHMARRKDNQVSSVRRSKFSARRSKRRFRSCISRRPGVVAISCDWLKRGGRLCR
jgi:excisionase family DNA binding protein